MKLTPLYQLIASSTQARLNCIKQEKITKQIHEWTERHASNIESMVKNFMPSGSGIDNGIAFDFDKSHGEKLVFQFSFHHMDDNGMYSGWTDHTLTVTPSPAFGFELAISGRNRNDIKEYFYDLFQSALCDLIDYDTEKNCYFSPSMREAQEAYRKQEDRTGN